MRLVDPSDDELNAAFAEKVAGWRWQEWTVCGEQKMLLVGPGLSWEDRPPQFTRSADAVLPFMNETFAVWSYHPDRPPGHLCCDRDRNYSQLIEAHGPFPRAAAIALLRVHGVEIIFNKQ